MTDTRRGGTGARYRLPDELRLLEDLVLDLHWTWSHGGDKLWRMMDAAAWDRTRNPWLILQSQPVGRLRDLAEDPEFLAELNRLGEDRARNLAQASWLQQSFPGSPLTGVAYFSMEFGLAGALPIYAGGLGVLAGDYLKTASDLGMPTVGIGLLYQQGYFRQMIDAAGDQQETYPFNDPRDLPLRPVQDSDGNRLRIALELPGRLLMLRVWQAQIGKVRLYLLDANDPVNSAVDRGITAALYGGGSEMRLLQELVLGIAGWRTVAQLAPEVQIAHLNEGHAAFVVVERTRRYAEATGLSFDQALWAMRAGTIFTTHTPVAAGFDMFAPSMVAKYLAALFDGTAPEDTTRVLALGQIEPQDDSALFNMATLAMRGAITTVGVSRLHGEVSRDIFQPMFPRWPRAEVPVGHVTNGVHHPSWDSDAADRLWTDFAGKERWRLPTGDLGSRIAAVADETIWQLRTTQRQALVGQVRTRLARQLTTRGADPAAVAAAELVFDPNFLTLGFARRFTEYKRPNLLLNDVERLGRLINHPNRPVQIVVAGKAHPADHVGKAMIRQWIDTARQPAFRPSVVFLEDYDLTLAQELVQGVDVWINTPRRPWEACGTSGMKVLVNGGMNISVLDGWWAEAYTRETGWAVGTGSDDTIDAASLYDLLEAAVAPSFYDRDPAGIPRGWLKRVRASMATLTPTFSSNRMLWDYLETYHPAVDELARRTEADGAAARMMAAWEERLRRHWHALRLGEKRVTSGPGPVAVSVPVYLGEVDPADVKLELYAEANGQAGPTILELTRGEPLGGAVNGWVYSAEFAGGRPPGDFTPRAVPRFPGVRVPAELPLVRWGDDT